MSFWSNEKLLESLPQLIDHHDVHSLDCASYTLHLGGQVYVTEDLSDSHPSKPLTQILEDKPPNNTVIIGAGQFAFLLTSETISVPLNAFALISVKASYKFRGLINVSGFHVDPGFSGKLIFSVYNAGPQPVILEKNQPLFLIFFADLDRTTNEGYKGNAKNRSVIDKSLIEGMSGQVFSPMLLQRQIKQLVVDQISTDKELASITSRGRLLMLFAGMIVSTAFVVLGALYSSDTARIIFGGLIKQSVEAHDKYITSVKTPSNVEH